MSFVKSLVKQLYGRLVKRRMQEFNIENRAHKLLDRDKLPPAPRHFTEEQALQKFLAANPHLKEEVHKKYPDLVDNMGRLKINVHYPPEMKTKKKKLPKDRQIIPKDTNFRVREVPVGCIDFEMFLKIYDYKFNHLWTNEEIAEEFDLEERHLDDLLFYFKPFTNRVVDKKQYFKFGSLMQDKTYVKMANILGRDVDTFQRIPDYKRELAKIEENNRAAELFEQEDEINEDVEEAIDKQIESLRFKHEIFFLRDKADEDTNGQSADPGNEGPRPDGDRPKETESDSPTEVKVESSAKSATAKKPKKGKPSAKSDAANSQKASKKDAESTDTAL